MPPTPATTDHHQPPSGDDPLTRLTAREREVAMLVGTGATNRQVARNLFITENTVEFHLGNIFRKLHISRRVQLAGLTAPRRSTLIAEEHPGEPTAASG